jgi:microcystin-dependent protein
MTTKVKPSVLADTAVTAGTYGGSQMQSVISVDAQGRLTSAVNVATSVAAANVTGKITASQIDTVASSQITGTITLTQVAGLTGEVIMWPAAAAPTGYLLCDGAAVSRTTYAALFAIIGTTYGTGNGSTTFNLPNFTNRMPIGVGDASKYSMGSVGGSNTAVLVSHTHTLGTAANGTFYAANRDGPSPTGIFSYTGLTASSSLSGGGLSGDIKQYSAAAHTHSISTEGSSADNANLPPYLGLQFIIRH